MCETYRCLVLKLHWSSKAIDFVSNGSNGGPNPFQPLPQLPSSLCLHVYLIFACLIINCICLLCLFVCLSACRICSLLACFFGVCLSYMLLACLSFSLRLLACLLVYLFVVLVFLPAYFVYLSTVTTAATGSYLILVSNSFQVRVLLFKRDQNGTACGNSSPQHSTSPSSVRT